MADNVAITAGSGTTIAADDIGGVLTQRVKVQWGPDGTVNDADVATGKPLPVQLRGPTGTDLTGTAGTASAAVLSVQGIASGTAVHAVIDSSTGLAQASTTSGQTGSLVMGAAQTSEATAVTTGQTARLVTDIVGKLINLPYANPENFTSGVTAAVTDTTSTSVIASQGGALRTYITSIAVSNSHATVGTFVKILDGSTIVWEAYAAAGGGGFIQNFPVPIKCTAATAVNAQAVTTGANFIACVAGYKGI